MSTTSPKLTEKRPGKSGRRDRRERAGDEGVRVVFSKVDQSSVAANVLHSERVCSSAVPVLATSPSESNSHFRKHQQSHQSGYGSALARVSAWGMQNFQCKSSFHAVEC